MAEFLLEALSEEIPARMQKRAAAEFSQILTSELEKVGLAHEPANYFVTPRRIAVSIEGLPLQQSTVVEERRGPRVDAPAAALDGFMRSNNISRDQIEERETKKGRFYFVEIETKGKLTKEVLPAIIETSLKKFAWPKSMRWGSNSFRWVRPLHSILAVFEAEVLHGELDLGHDKLVFTNMTRGHRCCGAEKISVDNFADYQDKLRKARVIIDRNERKRLIQEQAQKQADAKKLRLREDEALLEEVAGLVEWPNILMGSIDEEFMKVPSEALISAMRSHQKYFSLETLDGSLAPYFITVSNMPSDSTRDATIIAGNAKVLRARLSDARFFWDQDLKSKLDERVPALSKINFFDKLGSLGDKSKRLQKLVPTICEFIGLDSVDRAVKAARLAKADLSTMMVNEFPELQGVMGGYYASADGEPPEVCRAISGHYAPLGPTDACPSEPLTITISIADKIDTLVGFFAINEKPTGSKDPFALRRAALGIIRTILENKLRIPLKQLISKSLDEYPHLTDSNELLDFINERLKVYLRASGVQPDLIAANFEAGKEDDLYRLMMRVKALEELLASDDGANLLIANRRAANIVSIEAKKDKSDFIGIPDPKVFELEEERALFAVLTELEKQVGDLIIKEDFQGAMKALASLRFPLDNYFENVIVNSENNNIRQNRLKTLSLVRKIMNQVADFSLIEN